MELLVFALVMSVVVAYVAITVRPPEPSGSKLDASLQAKLASIEQGEKGAVEALARIAGSRTTPDPQRARALRMLAERAGDDVLSGVLSTVFRCCGRETCAEIFSLAERFPEPRRLEASALDVLGGSKDDELRAHALRALEAVGTSQCLPLLERLQRYTASIAPAAARARTAIAARCGDPRGGLSVPNDARGSVSEAPGE